MARGPRSTFSHPQLHLALRWLRYQAHMTRGQVAEKVVEEGSTLSESYLTDIERSRKAPSVQKLGEILNALGTDERGLIEVLDEQPWAGHEEQLTSNAYRMRRSPTGLPSKPLLEGPLERSLYTTESLTNLAPAPDAPALDLTAYAVEAPPDAVGVEECSSTRHGMDPARHATGRGPGASPTGPTASGRATDGLPTPWDVEDGTHSTVTRGLTGSRMRMAAPQAFGASTSRNAQHGSLSAVSPQDPERMEWAGLYDRLRPGERKTLLSLARQYQRRAENG